MEIISEEYSLNDINTNKKLEKNKMFNNSFIKIFSLIIILILVILVILILGILINISSSDSSLLKNKIGEINCLFFIQDISEPIKIIGDEFTKNTEFDIFINGHRAQYTKKYSFSSNGFQNVQFILYKTISLDYMFKDVLSLYSVNFFSNNNAKIISMESTFENCHNLYSFNFTGFNIEGILSMKKLFYKSQLVLFNENILNAINVKDMSYMFSSTKIEKFIFPNINFNNVKNISHLLSNFL